MKRSIFVLSFLFLSVGGVVSADTLTLRPNGVGDITQLSDNPSTGENWEKVDDVTPDINTTVYTGSSSAKYDLYTLPDRTTESGTINSVTIYIRGNADFEWDFYATYLKTQGLTYKGAYHSTELWTTYTETYATNPGTGSAWTWDQIDAMQIGAALIGDGDYAYTTQIYAVVDYTPAPPSSPTAQFSGTPTIGTAPLEVSFSDESTESPTSWCWDIDNDGDCDYETQNCTHTYTNTGLYTVKLTATNAYGSDLETKTEYIEVGEENETFPDGEGEINLDANHNRAKISNGSSAVTINYAGITDPALNISSLITNGTGSLPQITVNGDDGLTVGIPNGVTITNEDTSWNGIMSLPKSTVIELPVSEQETRTLTTAIEIGLSSEELSFDKGVRMVFTNQAGNRIGFKREAESFTEITDVCSADTQLAGDALSAGGSCKIDVGSDLVVWTKHFTSFGVFIATPVSAGFGGSVIDSSPPTPPQGGYVFTINNGASITHQRTALLTINGGIEAKRMAIANNGAFIIQENYSNAKQWTLSAGNGTKQVCIMFYSRYGFASDPICDTIYLEETSTNTIDTLISNTSYGQNNNNVKQLQTYLKELGFFPNDINTTGYYGTITHKSVVKYQISQQLSSKPLDQFTKQELIEILIQLIGVGVINN